MAEVVYWLGDASETTARVCMRSDTAGDYTVVCNGTTVGPLALDPAVEFGVGHLDVSGLGGNTAYPFSIVLGGVVQASGTLRTAPGAADSFYVGFAGCILPDADSVALYALVGKYDIRAFFSLGDMPYADSAIGSGGNSRFGLTNLPGTYTVPGNIDTWHNQFLYCHRDLPAFRYLHERVPVYKMWDDHELCNDYDHKLANVNAQFTAFGGSTFADQAAVDAFFNTGRTAFAIWSQGNPTNASPLKRAAKPASADAGTAAAQYPGEYFLKDLGAARFVVPDYITHRAAWDAADDGTLAEDGSATAKTILGRPQVEWMKYAVVSAPGDFCPVMSTKLWFNPYTSNNKGMNDFTSERDSLVAWIATHGRGVVFGASDAHNPCVIQNERHAMVNAGAIGQTEQSGSGAPGFLTTLYVEADVHRPCGFTPSDDTFRGVGLVHVTPGHLDWIILDDRGLERTRWRQYPNANTLVRVG